MKKPSKQLRFDPPLDSDILNAYLNKNAHYKRADARRMKRALQKLAQTA